MVRNNDNEPEPRPSNAALVFLWVLLGGFVGVLSSAMEGNLNIGLMISGGILGSSLAGVSASLGLGVIDKQSEMQRRRRDQSNQQTYKEKTHAIFFGLSMFFLCMVIG